MHRLIALCLAALLPLAALAHVGGDAADGIEHAFFVALTIALVTGAGLYARGLARLWRRAGTGRGIQRTEALQFALGWAALAAALVSPIDEGADRSFALHMVQHELLMVVAAPLIVLGRPLETWTWGLSPGLRRGFASALNTSVVRGLARMPTQSLGAWLLHALALWLWHLPLLFQAALRHPLLHILQHACFFGAALVYWWSAFGRARRPKGSAMASLFTTMLHTSVLGALLTFAPSPWYAAAGMRAFGLSALEDQQLGGLFMWVPGGLAYLIAGLGLLARWLAPPQRAVKA